ncbi:hypothetical protein GF420_04945 [candidate division GN15 bacterium]|nr:hypothetical protein [candidate division GN15 bacterium]
MSKRALVICYYFPPLGLGGVGRPLNLFKYLPQYGYECHVLTVKPVAYRAYEPELLHGLNTQHVFRSGSYDPQRMLYLMGIRTVSHGMIKKGKAVSDKYFPDSKIGWARPATRLGKKLIKKHDYDVIISTSPPISTHQVALDLIDKFSIPWIADFRDFWTMYRIEDSYTEEDNIRKGKELLARIRDNCTVITGVNPAIIDYIGEGEVIPNGYDRERAENWQAPPDSSQFMIGIPGNLNEERVIEPLLRTLEALQEESPDTAERIRLVQVGQVDREWFEALLREHGFETRCEIHGLQKRDDTIEIFSRCHLFYIGLTADKEQGILPQRLFDLAVSGRPILAYASRNSEISHFIDEIDNGLHFELETIDTAVSYLRQKIDDTTAGTATITPRPAYALPYSSDAMAERFARLMDTVA